MAGMILRKTGKTLFTMLKWVLQILLWVLKMMLGMTKLFLLLFFLTARVVLVMAAVSGNRR